MKTFIIEHLEPEMFPWCKLEYAHVSKCVGKRNLVLTNTNDVSLVEIGKIESKSVRDLHVENACVLDPGAKETLTSQIAKKFDVFIFGGILGDDPPKKRTGPELTSKLKYPAFNLGKAQMSTDTAVIVTKFILDGTPLETLTFQNGVDIHIKDGEEVHLPYKYLVIDGKPLLAPGIVKMLKEQETF